MLRAALSVLLVFLVCPAVPRALAGPSCAQGCKEDVAACRRAECAGLHDTARRACVARCRGMHGCAAIRTLAYVVTECRQDARGYSARQALRVQRGNCEPVTVAELQTPAPMRDPFEPGRCRRFGEPRAGYRSVFVGAFVRLGVSPDGSVVVFELTDDFSEWPAAFPPPLQEGLYRVGADGRGLRRLGAPSRAASHGLGVRGGRTSTFDVLYRFSPDSRTIVFTDRGPGPAGEDAIQIATLDLTTGRRTQVTRLPAAEGPFGGGWPVTTSPRFANRDTIVFRTFADIDGEHPGGGWFRIHTDGTGLEAAAAPVAIPGSRVRPTFDVAGGGTNLVAIELPGRGLDFFGLGGEPIREIFLLDGTNLLQLTNFHRADTGDGGKLLDRRARRGYFVASADPFGQNPSENCQLFSIGTLGTALRQLTHFHEVDRGFTGCGYTVLPGCAIGPIFHDQLTKRIVFHSACAPFGTGIFGGQVFSIRPDGTGLRQLTAMRGLVSEADGAVSAELPGPVAYSALDGGRALY